MKKEEPMITFENVTFKYNMNEPYALENVSFQVEDGQWLSILGHNGSGKSTIAKLLIGLLEAQQGSIYYNGVKLTEDTVDAVRKNVGIVFQNPDNQFVGYNVRYDIAFGMENHQIPRKEMLEKIQEFSTKVDMQDFLDREPQTLSGGQKQRVAIAGILALNCDIIILDEATSMLDPEGTKEITDLIIELKEKYNKTIIMITHDLALANRSDYILVLKNGHVIKEGKPKDVFIDRELLKSSNLDVPFSLRFYLEAKHSDILNKDERLMEALWEYHLKK
ncbi:MAG: energy-coupling factor transporter ATPase [Acholeplasmatales bacterium]|jgi:energy-coupling factor transport system ATP-binding protein|nr:energy-coupling factor transporter ATPase [Acholeplasmatales bacterium]MCI9653492.1 energy-coupling factor transporter ATPase [Acholeplasmatales bacterium]